MNGPGGIKKYGVLSLITVIAAAVIADTSIVKISNLVGWEFLQTWQNVVPFILMVFSFGAGQYLLLRYIERKGQLVDETGGKQRLIPKGLRVAVTITQYLLCGFLFLIIAQVILYSNYTSALVSLAASVSYGLAAIMMSLLAYKFFVWFNQNKSNSITILLYAISSAILATNVVTGLGLMLALSAYKPSTIGQNFGSTSIDPTPGQIDSYLNPIYISTSILGFALMWLATAILLRSRLQGLGKAKYWLLISIPLAFFLSQFLTLFFIQLTPFVVLYAVPFTLIFVFSKPLGGILFGSAFLKIARVSFPPGSTVRNYMTLAGYGVILFFISSQNTAAQPLYPPFGIVAALFVGLSAYLMFIGIYSSAISVSQDIKLRQSIRKSAIEESKLLDRIGTAEMEQSLQRTVLQVAKKNSESMIERTGIKPSLDEDQMKEYLNEVMKELKKNR